MSAWRDAVGMERERVVARIKTAQAEVDSLQAQITTQKPNIATMKAMRDEMDAFLATPEA